MSDFAAVKRPSFFKSCKTRLDEFRENARFIWRRGEVVCSDDMLIMNDGEDPLPGSIKHPRFVLIFVAAKRQKSSSLWDVQLRTKQGLAIRTKRKMLKYGASNQEVVELFKMYANTICPADEGSDNGIIIEPSNKILQVDRHTRVAVTLHRSFSFRKSRSFKIFLGGARAPA